jgi:hypothetical protein
MLGALAALGAAALLGVACGGGDEPVPAASDAPGAQLSGDNRPPVIDEVVLEPKQPRPGQSVRARVIASDPEGDSLSFDYSWRVGGSGVETKGDSLHVQSFNRGSGIEVTVVARDEHGGASEPVSATTRVGNLPPALMQVNLTPITGVTAGSDITANPIATDPEGDSIEYRFRWTLNGETLDVEGPTLPAGRLKRGDRVVLEVWAGDGSSESEPIESKPIEVVNAAPRIVSTPGAIGPDGVFRYELKAEDPDGDQSFRYRLVRGPQGMTVGFDDGKVVWTPPATAAGRHDVEVAVEDLFGARSNQSFALQLDFVTEAPPAARADQDE